MANDHREVGNYVYETLTRCTINYINVSLFLKPRYTTLVDVKIMEHTFILKLKAIATDSRLSIANFRY